MLNTLSIRSVSVMHSLDGQILLGVARTASLVLRNLARSAYLCRSLSVSLRWSLSVRFSLCLCLCLCLSMSLSLSLSVSLQ
eukprot:COSAG03_NODE_6444_length_1059_cov_1.608333_1_plen_80_part_10